MRRLQKHPKIIVSHLHRKKHHYIRGLIAGGVVVLLGALGWGSWHFIDARRIAHNPERQAQQTIERVQHLMVLPKDEQPAVVTVMDVSKVKNVPFLEHSAKNQDKILVYSKAKKVILYRPNENKIVDIGPVSIATPPEKS